MNIDSLVDFNKYTLAVAAACFVYALEKLPPMETQLGLFALLATLAALAVSSICGILLFFVATSAAHHLSVQQSQIPERHRNWIKLLGTSHSLLLVLGVTALAGMLYPKVMMSNERSVDCENISIIVGRSQ